MSALCAAIDLRGRPVGDEVLEAMVGAAPHRRTDGVARHGSADAAFAYLANGLDSPIDAQPVVDPDTGTVVLATARIDNRAELLASLPTTHGLTADADDVHLVAAAYRRWGGDCASRLLGDFAFVAWEPSVRRLVCARDPMAMRPLYVLREADRILVATEVAQLLAVPGVHGRLDERTVAAFLAGCFAPLEWTFYAGITQLLPGHALVVEEDRERVTPFWSVDLERRVVHRREADYAAELRELLVASVRARIRSDRPVGVLLSGGMDSGSAASSAGWLIEREQVAPQLRAYSWAFSELRECDERNISRHIVDRYGIVATDIPADDAGPLAGYPAHGPDPDEPYHGTFQRLVDTAFERCRQDGVGVLLSGTRGDLTVGPLDVDYATLVRERRWRALAQELRRHRRGTDDSWRTVAAAYVLPLARHVARRRSPVEWGRWAVSRLRGTGPVAIAPQPPALPAWVPTALSRRTDLPAVVAAGTQVPAPFNEPLRASRYRWVFTPMHMRWTVTLERRAARFGLQSADPWSDRRIVEYVLAVPQQVLTRPFAVDKRLAREAMRGIMPEAARTSSRKIVPTPLFERTLRGPAVPVVQELFSDSRAAAYGYVDPAALLRHYEAFVHGAPLAPQFWWAVCLEWWLRLHHP